MYFLLETVVKNTNKNLAVERNGHEGTLLGKYNAHLTQEIILKL